MFKQIQSPLPKTILYSTLSIIFIVYSTIVHASCSSNQTQMINSFNQFAFDLSNKINPDAQNTIMSPYSTSSVLATLSSGASGNTQSQLLQTLHLQNQTHCPLNRILDDLNLALSFSKPCTGIYCQIKTLTSKLGITSEPPSFIIANAIWGDKSFHYKSDFIDQFRHNNMTTFDAVDFKNNPEQAQETINSWVTKKTNGKIKDLINQGMITPITQLILVNAIYFRGYWDSPFEKSNTQQKHFTLENGKQSAVMMMQQTKYFYYFNNHIFQLLQLPYKDGNLMMVIILPHKNISLRHVQQSLNANLFSQLLTQSSNTNVDVSLPRFKLTNRIDFKNALQNLGVTDMFSDNANFNNLSVERLKVSFIIQNAMIDIDETGTTAAAATAGGVIFGSAPPSKPVIFNANHPFLFYIVDTKTRLILFMGKVQFP